MGWAYNKASRLLGYLSYTRRQRLRALPGLTPLQYWVLQSASTSLVRPETLLCIEGFPRSGNSFAAMLATLGVDSAMEGMAGQTHAIANIRRAVKWEIPTFVLVREPLECCSSMVLFGGCNSLDDALKGYNDFHSWLLPIVDRITGHPRQLLQDAQCDIRQVEFYGRFLSRAGT